MPQFQITTQAPLIAFISVFLLLGGILLLLFGFGVVQSGESKDIVFRIKSGWRTSLVGFVGIVLGGIGIFWSISTSESQQITPTATVAAVFVTQTDTPIPPTESPTPEEDTPTPVTETATSNPVLLDEQFSDLQYDGSLNQDLWLVMGETDSRIVSHAQSNGVLTSVMQPLESKDSEIHSLRRWPIREISYSEWRVKFDDSAYGDWASLALGLATDSNERFVCDFKFQVGEKGVSCIIWPSGQDTISITRSDTPIQANTWYILRISVINNPLEFRVYLDGQLVVSYVVKNPEPWESNQVHIYSSLAGDNIKSAITTHIDYVVVTGQ